MSVSLSSSGAATGEVLKWDGASFVWEPDSNTAYMAGQGLALSGTTFSIAQQAATAGQVLEWSGANWLPATDNDSGGDITDVFAGSGLSGGSTSGSATLSVGSNAITNTMLASDAASLGKVSGGSLTSISGDAFLGLSAELVLQAGNAMTPALTFNGDTNTGIFSSGPDAIGLSTGGMSRLQIDSVGNVSVTNALVLAGTGVSLTFPLDTDTGLSHPATDVIGFNTGGNERVRIDASGDLNLLATGGSVNLQSGSAAAPALTFAVDSNTGLYRAGEDLVGLVCNGTERLRITPLGAEFLGSTSVVVFAPGSAMGPSVTFSGDTNTGIYSPVPDSVAIATVGTQRMQINNSGFMSLNGDTNTGILGGADVLDLHTGGFSRLQLTNTAANFATQTTNMVDLNALSVRAGSGFTSAPSITFQTDLDTGASNPVADTVALSTAGAERMRITADGTILVGTTNDFAGKMLVYSGLESALRAYKRTDRRLG